MSSSNNELLFDELQLSFSEYKLNFMLYFGRLKIFGL